MKLAVITNDSLKKELLEHGTTDTELLYFEQVKDISPNEGYDGYLDLLFDGTEERIGLLQKFLPKPVIVNSVVKTNKELPRSFTRINGWNGFLKRPIIEASCDYDNIKLTIEKIFSGLNRQTEWVDDQPGFVTARIIAMIINEAFFTLGESVSTKQEIDTAMKLGTNYPMGPFEWAELIGKKNVYELLTKLSTLNQRYNPSDFLKGEVQ